MKILVIGQALPAVEQKLPYDTTMWYKWLEAVGISKEDSIDIFDYESVGGTFPGFDKGGHKKPSEQQMYQHYQNVLKDKISNTSMIILLGSVSKDFLISNNYLTGKEYISLIHPSNRNMSIYTENRVKILDKLSKFIWKLKAHSQT